MKLYHRTYHAEAILADGFRDGEGSYLTRGKHRGVWVADRSLDENESAEGDVVLVVEAPERAVVPFEWIEEGKTYREFLIPAGELNRHPIGAVMDDPLPERDAVRHARGLPPRP